MLRNAPCFIKELKESAIASILSEIKDKYKLTDINKRIKLKLHIMSTYEINEQN